MELNLLSVLNYDGKKLQITEDVELSSADNDSFKIVAPVHFEGCATNISGTIELVGEAKTKIEMICDRCTETYTEEITFTVDEKMKREDAFSDNEEDPDFLIFSGFSVDFDEILYTNLFMALPSKSLCSEDCIGICPVCGKNLNHEECSCDTRTTDPRFDILDKLL